MSAPTAIMPFTTFAAVAVPIDIANCDTDQIIPARYLRRAEDDPDFPSYFLHDLRFDQNGNKTDFIFNQPPYAQARIIVADVNWGCGSSREHAVMALTANHVRAIIAPSIGDIHYTNCIRNGVLPVILTQQECDRLRQQLHESPGAEIAIDLDTQSITGPDQAHYTYQIDAFDKYRLINGLDDITMTLEYDGVIRQFNQDYTSRRPWSC